MIAQCPSCSRANPPQALFCYYDGALMPGRHAQGRLQAGTAPFPMPFVFADGTQCTNFNQVALACQKNWSAARDALREGHWTQFMQSIGRHDLARAAQQAQKEADPDQGLDLFLGKIPCEVLQEPKLVAQPRQLSLGVLKPGRDQKMQVTIENHGMRLLRGSLRVDCDWLTLGDGAGAPELFFQTPTETHITLRVVGKHFRAEAKPKKGAVTILTNGGEDAIIVTAEAPVIPYPDGILAGATTPREIAKRSKQNPKQAAPAFESGGVEAWYKNNGWEYPVQGPAGSGLGAIQQFFEALGLVKPPVVTIDQQSISLSAAAGNPIDFTIGVRSAEQKPVFAHARSNQPWLVPGPPVFAGNKVTMPMLIARVPPGSEAKALVTVVANGNQRFLVPVVIAVKGGVAPLPEAATFEAVTEAPRRPASRSQPVMMAEIVEEPAPAGDDAVFGMGRMVYWSALLGGWSALAGWMVSEALVGRWIGQYLLLGIVMVFFVAAAIGGGLSILGSLVTRQWNGVALKILVGATGGAIAGIVGGTIAFGLYALIGNFGGPIGALLSAVGRVFGLVLVGLAIGGWEGVYLRDRVKLRNGLIGGAVGGLIGGMLFNPLLWLIGGAMSSRAFAFVVLGLFIGLFIGLVQVLLKDGWLTVTDGFRPGRQLILSQQLTTLGTSERASLIFIAYGSKGVEPIHVAIERTPEGAFLVTDQESRTGTYINGEPVRESRTLRDGDVIQLGVNKVRFNERVRQTAT